MLMTGTPIENHLGELWNLFHFINPGLLGSLENFNSGSPCRSSATDCAVRLRLKQLIQPFILRRHENAGVRGAAAAHRNDDAGGAGDDGSAFYEALRQQAVESLAGSRTTADGQQSQILAEIMRLRRACCHPGWRWPRTSPAPSSAF